LYLRFAVVVCYCLISGCATQAMLSESAARSEFAQEKRVREIRVQAELLYQSGEYEKTEVILRDLLEISETDVFANYRMGSISFGQGDVEQAAVYFGNVIKTDSKNTKANYNLAVIYLIQAQNSLQQYAASSSADTDLGGVFKILREIDDFAKTNALQGLVQKKSAKMGSIKRSRTARFDEIE